MMEHKDIRGEKRMEQNNGKGSIQEYCVNVVLDRQPI